MFFPLRCWLSYCRVINCYEFHRNVEKFPLVYADFPFVDDGEKKSSEKCELFFVCAAMESFFDFSLLVNLC